MKILICDIIYILFFYRIKKFNKSDFLHKKLKLYKIMQNLLQMLFKNNSKFY